MTSDNRSFFNKSLGGAKPRPKKTEDTKTESQEKKEIMPAAEVFAPEKKQSKKVKKTERIGLVMKPDLHRAIKSAAKESNMSANEYCLQIIANNLQQRGLFHPSED